MTIIDSEKIQDLIVEFEGEMVIITINRPNTLNALNLSVFSQLAFVFERMLDLKEIKCIVITGAGQKAFVAGADIGCLLYTSMLFCLKAIRTSRLKYPYPMLILEMKQPLKMSS